MNATAKRRTSRTPPPPIEDQIHGMSDNVLMCRDLRHAWSIETGYYSVTIEGGARGAKYLERRLACMRCDTHRVELVRVHKNRIEKIGSPYYVYPEGYQVKGAKRSDDVQGKVRWEQVRRVMEAAHQHAEEA